METMKEGVCFCHNETKQQCDIMAKGHVQEGDLMVANEREIMPVKEVQQNIAPTEAEMQAALVARHGAELQEKFNKATVAICGLGGLGSNVAIALARAGVGHLHLIDFDKVDLSNLNRQQYSISQLGMYKTEALRENLLAIAPYCHIRCDCLRITEEKMPALLTDADIICECFDKAEEKAMLTLAVLEYFPQKTLVGASGMAGLGSSNTITTRKIFKNYYLCGDGVSDVEKLGTLFAPRVMLCAAHQANVVLEILAGKS